MLVLSRRPDERIVFPNLGITVHILRIAGNVVRVGVDAPTDVRVIRHELMGNASRAQTLDSQGAVRRKLKHLFQNALNVATVAAHLAKRQISLGQHEHAEETLSRAIEELTALDRHNEAHAHDRAAGAPRPGQPQRYALLVEDNANECELLAGYLRVSGFDVDTASDGLEAINRLSQSPRRPDAVLLDMQLPRFDGVKTINSIRTNPELCDLKVYAVTGTSRHECGISIGPQGVDRWFAKPINPRELVAHMEQELTAIAT